MTPHWKGIRKDILKNDPSLTPFPNFSADVSICVLSFSTCLWLGPQKRVKNWQKNFGNFFKRFKTRLSSVKNYDWPTASRVFSQSNFLFWGGSSYPPIRNRVKKVYCIASIKNSNLTNDCKKQSNILVKNTSGLVI